MHSLNITKKKFYIKKYVRAQNRVTWATAWSETLGRDKKGDEPRSAFGGTQRHRRGAESQHPVLREWSEKFPTST